MKIGVTSTGPTLEDHVSIEFGDSKYLLIVDLDTLNHEAIISPVIMDDGSAGGKLLGEQLLRENASKILTGHTNFDLLESFLKSLQGTGVQMIDVSSGSVRSVVRQFKEMCAADTVVMPCEDIEYQESAP